MNDIIQEYTYFFSSSILITTYIIFYLSFPKHRFMMIFCGIVALPQALFSFLLVPDYWDPKRIFGKLIGIEDFMFVFFTGGIVWIEAIWFFRKRIRIEFEIKLFLKRFVFYMLFGLIAGALLHTYEIRGVYSYFLMLIWSLILIFIKKELWILLFSGLALYPATYILSFKILQVFWPDVTSLWTWENLWGLHFWSIPIEEIVWCLLYASAWPVTIAYLFNVKIQTNETVDRHTVESII